jgi:hypothetical protein
MKENRVTTKEFGTLESNSKLLVPVPTTAGHPQQRLHVLAAQSFIKMSEAVYKNLGFPLLCASGWRPHRWKSWQEYQDFVVIKYGSLSEGRKWLAFDSPHETGLACDIGCGGLEPNRLTISQQIKMPLYDWLDKNESLYGFTDFQREPWHKEYKISLAAFKTGIPDNQTLGPIYHESNYCEENSCIEVPDEYN